MNTSKLTSNTGLTIFIVDEETKFLFPKGQGMGIIVSENDLAKIPEHTKDLKAIVILAELDWQGRHLQHFYGLDLARKIRIEYGCFCPIVICSTLTENFLLTTPIPNLDFYKSPGIYYLSISDIVNLDEFLNKTEFIDEETLLDIAESFGGQEGIINNVIHDLKNKQSTLFDNKTEIKNTIKEQFIRLKLYFRGNEFVVEQLENSFINEIFFSSSIDNVIMSVLNLETELLKLLTKETPGDIKQYHAKWKILFLDDEKNIREFVKEGFKKHGLECDVAADKEKLYELLNNDEQYNYYTLLICDYRLKESGCEKHSHKQGYSVLKEVYLDKPNYLSLFALSSMKTKILLRFRERYNMKVWSFSKDDIQVEAGFNIFCTKVFEEGEKMFDTICNLPKNDPKVKGSAESYNAWFTVNAKRDKPFGHYYRQFRMSDNFEDEERRISKEAKQYFYDIISKRKFSHNYEFTAGLANNELDSNKLTKLKNKLIGRRIYLALRFVGKFAPIDLWHRMQPEILYDAEKYAPETPHIAGLFQTHLCMPEDFEKKPVLMTEEKYWLKNEMAYDIDEIVREALNEIFDILKEYWDEVTIDANNELIRSLKAIFDKNEILGIGQLDNILRLFKGVENSSSHINSIQTNIKNRISELRRQSEKGNRADKQTANTLLDKLSTGGILDLLDKYGLKPMKERAEPIRSLNKKSKKKEVEEESNEIIDPDTPEGQSLIETLGKDFSSSNTDELIDEEE